PFLGKTFEVGADRVRANERRASLEHDAVPLAIDTRLELAIDGIEEVIAVMLDVESEKIVPEEAFQNLAFPGADPECFGVGPWNVPELAHNGTRRSLLDQSGKQREVIILDEDQGPGLSDFVEDSLGELLVDGNVLLPVLFTEEGPLVGDVAKRPKSFVGQAVVVPLLFL